MNARSRIRRRRRARRSHQRGTDAATRSLIADLVEQIDEVLWVIWLDERLKR
jgi:hypothetical protein